MDPCNFLRIVINNLAIRFPSQSTSPSEHFFCKIKLAHFSTQSAPIPILPSTAAHPDAHTLSGSVCFTMTRPDMDKLMLSSKKASKRPVIKVDVYSRKAVGCGLGFGASGKLVGRVRVPVEISQQTTEGKGSTLLHNGWVYLGQKNNNNPEVYLTVKANPDPRFVFEFDSDPECSPQVFQVQGKSSKQPVFSCKFGFKGSYSSSDSSCDKISYQYSNSNSKKEERKGWWVTIHDLSGSPVAAAGADMACIQWSQVTPLKFWGKKIYFEKNKYMHLIYRNYVCEYS